MKYLMNNEQLLPQIMLLRFGIEKPKSKEASLFSMAVVAMHLKINVSKAYAIEAKYFRDLSDSKQPRKVLSFEQIDYLTNDKYLRLNCCNSLQDRALMFNGIFPNSKVSRHQLGRIYRERGIRNKKMIKVAANPKKYTEDFKHTFVQNMITELIQIDKKGNEIFQIDESLFSSQDCRKKAWSLPNQNIEYQHLSSHTGLLGVIGAISSKQDVIFSQYKKGYFNSDDTIKFIRSLKRFNAGKKIALFLDNCSTHTAKKVKEFLNQEKIPYVYNLAYSPRFNGIERLWAQMKRKFRDELAILKLRSQKYQVETVVEVVENSIQGSTVIACASSGWQHILKNQKQEVKTNVFQNVQIIV